MQLRTTLCIVLACIAWVSFYISGLKDEVVEEASPSATMRGRALLRVTAAAVEQKVQAPRCENFKRKVTSKEPSKLDLWYGEHAERWRDAYVVPDAKVIFCQIHKVGSTKWLRLLRWLDGQDYNAFPHLWVGTRPGNLSTLRHYPKREALEMMFDPKWTKIVVVRDPLDRLRSAYFSKVNTSTKHPNSSLEQIAQPLNVPIERLKELSFDDFVTRVEAGIREEHVSNLHWRPQTEACSLGHFQKCYQYVTWLGDFGIF